MCRDGISCNAVPLRWLLGVDALARAHNASPLNGAAEISGEPTAEHEASPFAATNDAAKHLSVDREESTAKDPIASSSIRAPTAPSWLPMLPRS